MRDILRRNEEGQSMVEYGLIVGLVVLVAVAAVAVFGDGVAEMYNNISLHEALDPN